MHVEQGESVEEGQLLMVVEAMKMEHRIQAQGAAVVCDVLFAVGDRVAAGELLVSFEEQADETEGEKT